MNSLAKNIIFRKLKAGSIFYALIISLLVGIISTSMITLTFSNRFLEERDDLQKRLTRNALSGIQLLLADNDLKTPVYKIDLFGEERDSLSLEKKNWGLFSIALSTAFHHTSKKYLVEYKAMQIGLQPAQKELAALVLEDQDRPLVITGDTYIKGNAYLPEAQVQSASIGDIPYSRKKLIEGEILASGQQLPKLNKSSVRNVLHYFNLSANTEIEDSINQSFFADPIIIKDSVLIIENKQLSGQVIVVADSLIYIGQNTIVEDVIFAAPYIFIEAGFKGNIQAFATKFIEVGENAKLYYPSVLGLIKNQHLEQEPSMHIQSDCSIKGLVWVHNSYPNKRSPYLKIDKGAIIEGQVFAECTVELSGQVYGNISCQSFFLRYGASSYSNYLFDTEINFSKRSKHYLSPFLLENQKPVSGIVKHLQ